MKKNWIILAVITIVNLVILSINVSMMSNTEEAIENQKRENDRNEKFMEIIGAGMKIKRDFAIKKLLYGDEAIEIRTIKEDGWIFYRSGSADKELQKVIDYIQQKDTEKIISAMEVRPFTVEIQSVKDGDVTEWKKKEGFSLWYQKSPVLP